MYDVWFRTRNATCFQDLGLSFFKMRWTTPALWVCFEDQSMCSKVTRHTWYLAGTQHPCHYDQKAVRNYGDETHILDKVIQTERNIIPNVLISWLLCNGLFVVVSLLIQQQLRRSSLSTYLPTVLSRTTKHQWHCPWPRTPTSAPFRSPI